MQTAFPSWPLFEQMLECHALNRPYVVLELLRIVIAILRRQSRSLLHHRTAQAATSFLVRRSVQPLVLLPYFFVIRAL